MPLKRLDHTTLGALDNGAVGALIDEAIATAMHDLSDRGDDGQPRVVTITLDMRQKGRTPIVEAKVSAKVPPYRSGPTAGLEKSIGNGRAGLFFQPMNAESADQPTMYDDEE